MSKNDIKKAEAVMDGWATEDLNKGRLSAGKLTEEGTIFTPTAIEESEGKHGVFWVIEGLDKDKKPVELTFSSQKLHQLVVEHWNDMVNKPTLFRGFGQGFDREYHVRLA